MFQLNSKKLFLTYPQINVVDFTIADIRFFISTTKPSFKYLLIAQESHANGGHHYHLFIEFHTPFRTRDPRCFDINGYHCNIQSARNTRAVIEYIKKDGTFEEWGQCPINNQTTGLERIVEESNSKEMAFEKIKASKHREVLLYGDRIWRNLSYYFEDKREIYVPSYTEFTNVPEILKRWVETNISNRPSRPISLCLCGPSRMGKTEWARSIARHSYFAEMFNLEDLDEEGRYAIFDDFKINFIPAYKGWFGGQRQFTVTDKYKHKKTIIWGKPSIFLCNIDRLPHFDTCMEETWWNTNVLTINIATNLY